MALNFDPTKRIKKTTSSVKIFEEPIIAETEIQSLSPAMPKLEVETLTTVPKLEDRPDWLNNDIKPTNNLLRTTEKPTNETYENQPNNLLKTYEQKKPTNVKPPDTPTNNPRTNLLRTTEKPTNVNQLVGIQRTTFLSLVKSAKDFGFLDNSGNRITPPINGNEFAKTTLNKTYKQTKDTLYHLKLRGFIGVYSMKNGRGGNVQYLIEKEIYQSCLIELNFDKPTNNLLRTTEKPPDTPTNKPTNTALSSNSDLNNKENTNTENFDFDIPENVKALGVGNRQLAVIVRDNFLSAEEVQQSLEHYSHDVGKNLVKKSNNFFFGVLRNKTPYISSQYAQGEARAVQEEIARIKQTETEREELKELKLREEYEQFKLSNPNFLEDMKKENQFLTKSPTGLLDRMGFDKWKENLNT